MHSQYAVGTLLPLFSLYTTHTKTPGIIENGTFFIDWLTKTHQSAWQMLPLHETHCIKGTMIHAPSPYQSYGIGLHPRFLSTAQANMNPTNADITSFINKHKGWITDYALFCVLRDRFGTDDWREWDADFRVRNPDVLLNFSIKEKENIDRYIRTQWQLHDAYDKVKRYAEVKGIQLIGDIPFYLSINSPLVWMFQKAFLFSEGYALPRVSGVVNETKAFFGRQVWGHPLYNWESKDALRAITALCDLRLSYLPNLFHVVRLDHANGFYLYGSLDPVREENDEIKHGPGEPFFQHIIEKAKEYHLLVFAEDAAVELSELRKSMQRFHIPGIRILRFAYDEEHGLFENDYIMPSLYPKESIAFTSNHDTETLLGFIQKLTPSQKEQFSQKIQIPYTTDTEFAVRLREAVISSPSLLHIIPLQDWLLSIDRINTPGTEKETNDPNWQYTVSTPVEEYPLDF